MQDAFIDLCRDAANHGTAIVLEIMPFGNVNTIEAGRAIVEGANQSNGFLLIDVWHMARGGIDYSDIVKKFRSASSAQLNWTTRMRRWSGLYGMTQSIAAGCPEKGR